MVKRFYAQVVAREKELTLLRIPKGKCEHAIKTFDTCRTPLFVGVDNDLRIRLRLELMTEACQLFSQFDEVVNFPIKNNLNASVFVPNRLPSTTDVNNAKSPMA